MSLFETHEELMAVITGFDDRFDFHEFHEFFKICLNIFLKIYYNRLDDFTYNSTISDS